MATQHCELRLRVPAAAPQERGDHGDVPDYGGGVGEQEAAMAVENSQAPRGEDEHGRAGKKNLHEVDGEQALVAMKAGGNEIDEPGRGEDAGDRQQGGDEKQEREDGFGELRGFFAALLGAEARIDGDEGGRKHALAEKILQKIGNAKRGAEGVGGVGVAEVVREDAIADEADQAAEQDADGDEKRMRFGGCAAGWGGQRMIIRLSGSASASVSVSVKCEVLVRSAAGDKTTLTLTAESGLVTWRGGCRLGKTQLSGRWG